MILNTIRKPSKHSPPPKVPKATPVHRCSQTNLPLSIISALIQTRLALDVVDEALHAGLHAECVLTWQQLGVAEPIQADAARQERLETLHLASAALLVCNTKCTDNRLIMHARCVGRGRPMAQPQLEGQL